MRYPGAIKLAEQETLHFNVPVGVLTPQQLADRVRQEMYRNSQLRERLARAVGARSKSYVTDFTHLHRRKRIHKTELDYFSELMIAARQALVEIDAERDAA